MHKKKCFKSVKNALFWFEAMATSDLVNLVNTLSKTILYTNAQQVRAVLSAEGLPSCTATKGAVRPFPPADAERQEQREKELRTDGLPSQKGRRRTRQTGGGTLWPHSASGLSQPSAAPPTCCADSLNGRAAAAPEAFTVSPSSRLAGSRSIAVAATGLLALARYKVMVDKPNSILCLPAQLRTEPEVAKWDSPAGPA